MDGINICEALASFSWWRFQFQFFGIGLALLLAKGALELRWLCSHFCIFGGSFLNVSEQTSFAGKSSCSTGGTHTQRGTSGPKSRRHPHKSSTRLGFWLLSLIYLYMTLWQGGWGEGCGQAMMAAEVQNTPHAHLDMGTKLHGLQPQACFGTTIVPDTARKRQNKVVKRSLQRAYRRSQQQGMAWYKGKLFCTADLSVWAVPFPYNVLNQSLMVNGTLTFTDATNTMPVSAAYQSGNGTAVDSPHRKWMR